MKHLKIYEQFDPEDDDPWGEESGTSIKKIYEALKNIKFIHHLIYTEEHTDEFGEDHSESITFILHHPEKADSWFWVHKDERDNIIMYCSSTWNPDDDRTEVIINKNTEEYLYESIKYLFNLGYHGDYEDNIGFFKKFNFNIPENFFVPF